MRYQWIERNGHYCAASDWQASDTEEYRLVFPLAAATEINSHLLDTRLEWFCGQLVFYRPGSHVPIPTGVMGNTICADYDTRAIRAANRRTR